MLALVLVQDKKKRWGVTGDYPEKSDEGEQRHRKISVGGNCREEKNYARCDNNLAI